jgi:hypothetical protein
MDDYGIDLMKEVLGYRKPTKSDGKSRPFEKKDVPSLAKFIKSDACRKIYLMVILSCNPFAVLWVIILFSKARCRYAPCPVRKATRNRLTIVRH